jgi:hypothetical protein
LIARLRQNESAALKVERLVEGAVEVVVLPVCVDGGRLHFVTFAKKIFRESPLRVEVR